MLWLDCSDFHRIGEGEAWIDCCTSCHWDANEDLYPLVEYYPQDKRGDGDDERVVASLCCGMAERLMGDCVLGDTRRLDRNLVARAIRARRKK